MQISITILFVFLCLNVQAQEQKCAKYDEAMKNGYEYLNTKNYDKALIEFQAAQVAARECDRNTNAPAIELKKVFDGLKAQRDEAIEAKKEAEKARREAVSQKEANQNLLARNYWNNSQAARADNDLLSALYFTAEAVASSNDKYLTKNLLIDIEPYLPVVNLNQVLIHKDSISLSNFNSSATELSSACFSADGKKILALEHDTVRLWDAVTGKELANNKIIIESGGGGYGNELAATFSSDGKRILTAGGFTTARIWDANTGQLTKFRLHYKDTTKGRIVDVVDRAFFSADSKRIITAVNNTFCVWNSITGEQIGHTIEQNNNHNSMAIASFSPDGKQFLIASGDTIRLWKTDSVEQIGSAMVFKDHSTINSAVFTPDGKYILATYEHFENACLWETATNKLIDSTMLHDVYTATFSRDGGLILTGDGDSTERIWYYDTRLPTGIVMKSNDYIKDAIFSPDGKYVLTSNWNNVTLWDVVTGKQLGPAIKFETSLHSVAFNPNALQFLTATEDGTIRIWDINKVSITDSTAHYTNVKEAIFSPNGQQLLTISPRGTIQILDVKSGKVIDNDLQHENSVISILFSSDGKEILTASSEDNTIRLWDANTGKQIGKDMKDTNIIENAIFNFDETQILVVTSYTTPLPDKPTRLPPTKTYYINLWDARTGRRMEFAKWDIETAARFYNSDNKKQYRYGMEYGYNLTTPSDYILFSSGGKDILRVFNRGDSTTLLEKRNGKQYSIKARFYVPIQSAVFSNDGKFILTIGKDGIARLWQVSTGKQVGPAIKHEGDISSAVFSPDGKMNLTTGNDKTVRLWETGTGKQIGSPIKYEKEVNKAYFNPEGTRILAITNQDSTSTAYLWNIPGDLDIPGSLFKLQVQATTGIEFNNQTSEIQPIPAEQWNKLKQEYNNKAREHYKTCQYREYNFWARFNPEEAKVITANK